MDSVLLRSDPAMEHWTVDGVASQEVVSIPAANTIRANLKRRER